MKQICAAAVFGATTLLGQGCDPGGPAGWGSEGNAGASSLLESFACDPRATAAPVEEFVCEFRQYGVLIYAADQDDRYLVSALYLGFDPGLQETWYSGEMTRRPNVGSRTSVAAACVEASSAYTPDPCQLDLLVLERGTVETMGAAGAASEVEVGSRVRLRVMCPDGLYSPSGDDYGARHYDITPSEFVLEARDCTVED